MKENKKNNSTKSKTPSKIIIELQDVWKTYALGAIEVQALRGLSLAVKKGEFAAIMGPSGSGKSTSMNIVGCLDLPTRGKVLLDGQDIALFHESDLAAIRGRKIGFVFQSFNLISSLSALENVTLPMIFQNIPEEKRISIGTKLLEKVGLGKRLHHKPTELSGGEQQRVAIARSLCNDPEIILGDEPTGNLDSVAGKVVMDLLRKLHKEEKKTIIIVTHDKNVGAQAERIFHLKDGKLERIEVRK